VKYSAKFAAKFSLLILGMLLAALNSAQAATLTFKTEQTVLVCPKDATYNFFCPKVTTKETIETVELRDLGDNFLNANWDSSLDTRGYAPAYFSVLFSELTHKVNGRVVTLSVSAGFSKEDFDSASTFIEMPADKPILSYLIYGQRKRITPDYDLVPMLIISDLKITH
jgi:hypothetical protein